MIKQKEIERPPLWCAMTVTGGWEVKTVERINSGGFIAHCPVYSKKYRARWRGSNLMRVRSEPLFGGYIFVQHDAAFRKGKFETTQVMLGFIRGGFISDAQMSVINSTAMELTLAQSKATVSLAIKRGDVMQILHGAMQGEPVEALQARKDQVLIRWKERIGWKDAWINRSSLGRVV